MPPRLTPLIVLPGCAAEALDFYRDVLGGTVTATTFRDHGFGDTADADRIMRGRLDTPAGLTLRAVDVRSGLGYETGRLVVLALSGEDRDELAGWFDALAERGTVVIPLAPQPWGHEVGQLVDRFGVTWFMEVTTATS